MEIVFARAVGEHHATRTIEQQRIHAQLAVQSQVDGVDRRVGLVAKDVSAAHARVPSFGIEIDLDHDGSDARLGDALELLVPPLVFGADVPALATRREVVQDVGVVEQKAAEADEEETREGRDRPRRSPKPESRQVGAPSRMGLLTTDPQQVREHGEQNRERDPIDLPDDEGADERSPAIHVRVLGTAVGRILVQIALEPELRHQAQTEKGDEHDQVPEILVVHDDVNRERQHREQQNVDQTDAKQCLEIERNLEAEITLDGLGTDAGHHDHREEQHEHRRQGGELREEAGHVRSRRGVRDLVDLHVPFRPHQLARVERDDDEHEQAEAAVEKLDHAVRHRPRRRAEQLAHLLRGEDEKEHPCPDDRVEVPVAHDAPERAHGERPVLGEPRRHVERLPHSR